MKAGRMIAYLVGGGIVIGGLMALTGGARGLFGGGLGGGRGFGGDRRDTTDPNLAGAIPGGTVTKVDASIDEHGLMPSAVYLAGSNVFLRGTALLWAWRNGIEPMIASVPGLSQVYDRGATSDALILAVATPPNYRPGGRSLFVAIYDGTNQEQAAADLEAFFREAAQVVRKGFQPGEA